MSLTLRQPRWRIEAVTKTISGADCGDTRSRSARAVSKLRWNRLARLDRSADGATTKQTSGMARQRCLRRSRSATGKIIASHSKRRRRVEFLDFMDSVTSAFPDRQLHVILDNLCAHKKNEHWLKARPNVQFHFTPTSASWLNQVEVWFSILQGQSLSGASFASLKPLEQHIDAYIEAYNDKAQPFVWTKKKVRQRQFQRPPYHSAMIPLGLFLTISPPQQRQ